jgi:hypothetical protein
MPFDSESSRLSRVPTPAISNEPTMHAKPTRLMPLALMPLAVASFAACTPVRLLEPADPRIEDGVAAYQESLETFVRRTERGYRQCEAQREEAMRLARASCEGSSRAVVEACDARIREDRSRVDLAVASSCGGASYDNARDSFYIPEAARLSVLRSRAAVLDSTGACAAAARGLAALVGTSISAQVRNALGTDSAEPGANCTEAVVQTVIDNHDALAEGHRRIDQIAADSMDGLGLADQAEAFFQIQRDTLVQNVRIVMLLEEAKKRDGARR